MKPTIANPLDRAERFAVSLRKQRKAQIITERRKRLASKLGLQSEKKRKLSVQSIEMCGSQEASEDLHENEKAEALATWDLSELLQALCKVKRDPEFTAGDYIDQITQQIKDLPSQTQP